MIDLHIHTLYSDGSDSVLNILQQAQRLNIGVLSITDHDSVKAYFDLDKLNISNIYSGKIITGVEFTTTFDGYTTEILGYGCDYNKINKILTSFYTPRFVKKQYDKLMNEMAGLIKTHNLIFDFNNKKNCESFMAYYNELSKHEENYLKVKDNILDSFGNFIRKGYANPKSSFYVDKSTCYLKFDEIVDIIHDAGGVAILAHPFIYQFEDITKVLNKMFKTTHLDGLECYYHSFSQQQTNFLLKYAKENKLLVSGGTDYHGTLRPQSKLGVGGGNLNISKEILNNWNVKYFKD